MSSTGRPPSSEDVELMRRISGREEQALRELYDRYAGYCFAICLRVLTDRHEAELVLTDVFAEVWRKPDRFRPERGSVVGYLVVLARSRAIDHLRSNKQVQSRPLTSGDSTIAGPEGHPAAASMSDERRTTVRTALGSLPADQREVVELAFFGGLTQAAIAVKLSKPIGTIKTLARKGLCRLRDMLRENPMFD